MKIVLYSFRNTYRDRIMRLSVSYFLEGYPRRTEGKHCRLPTHRRNLSIESERMPAYCANQKISRHSWTTVMCI